MGPVRDVVAVGLAVESRQTGELSLRQPRGCLARDGAVGRLRRIALISLTLVVVVATDLGTKALANSQPRRPTPGWLLGTIIGIDPVMHRGLNQLRQAALGAAGAAFLLGIAFVARRNVPAALATWIGVMCALAVGGIVANNLDLALHGTVTDWLLVGLPRGHNSVINIADAVIVLGAAGALCLTAIGLWWHRRRRREQA